MEPLWSPAVATGSNRWQMRRPQERLKQAKTVAVGCDWLPGEAHGKEGVDGSSPSEGSAKAEDDLIRSRRTAQVTSGSASSAYPFDPSTEEGLKPKTLPWVATGCRSQRMVGGSTVRARKAGSLLSGRLQDRQRAVGMEPFMEPPDREVSRSRA